MHQLWIDPKGSDAAISVFALPIRAKIDAAFSVEEAAEPTTHKGGGIANRRHNGTV